MRRRPLLAVALAAGLLVPALAAGPAAAAQTPAPGACTVDGGQLDWGFKESFRSYISGIIANGAWEPEGGATYTTPVFGWPASVGTFDPATGAGEVSFAGGIRFTGHGGLLDTTISDPTLVLPGDGTAQLLIDVSGVTMEDALAGDTGNVHTAARVPFVSLDLAAAPLEIGTDTVSAASVPTAITEQGFVAFPNYAAGTAFDPITVTFALACPAVRAEQALPGPSATVLYDDMQVDPVATVWAWLAPVLIAVVVVAGVLVAVFVVLVRRDRRSRESGGRP